MNSLRPEKSEVERLWADNKKAKELLGWEPQYGEKMVSARFEGNNRMVYKSEKFISI